MQLLPRIIPIVQWLSIHFVFKLTQNGFILLCRTVTLIKLNNLFILVDLA